MNFSFIDTIKEKFGKDYYRCVFIDKNKQITYKVLKQDKEHNIIKYNNRAYIIDTTKILYDKEKAYLFYYVENPNPITFAEVKHDIRGVVIDSKSVNDLVNTKVIREIISMGKEEGLILILLVAIISLLLINLMFNLGILHTTTITQAVSNETINQTISNITVK